MNKELFLRGRAKMETQRDVLQEYRYASFIASKVPVIDRIDKLNPMQYGIDWAAYNAKGQVLWFGEFKRRYKPYSFFEDKVIGVSAYKVAKLFEFGRLKPVRFIWGLDDCVLSLNGNREPVSVKYGGNPKPKDMWEKEPMAYFEVAECNYLEGPIDEITE